LLLLKSTTTLIADFCLDDDIWSFVAESCKSGFKCHKSVG
jgi:hypothetical protein